MAAYPTATTRVSFQLRMKRTASVPTTWIKLWITMAKLLFSASAMVSMSLVK